MTSESESERSKSEASAWAWAWARALGLSVCCYNDQWSWENGANERNRWYDQHPTHTRMKWATWPMRKARKERYHSSWSGNMDGIDGDAPKEKTVRKVPVAFDLQGIPSIPLCTVWLSVCLSACLSVFVGVLRCVVVASSPFHFLSTHLPSTHGFPLCAMASVGRLFGFCLSVLFWLVCFWGWLGRGLMVWFLLWLLFRCDLD